MYPRLKPLAALLPLIIGTHANAALELAALDPVLVTATRSATRSDAVLSDVTIITEEEIRASHQTTLPELLGTQPGIQFRSNGGSGTSGSLFIRGTNSEHSLVLVDGQRISSATLGTTAIEHIPLSAVERIEIVRGPVSSLYGADAIGGVIQIFTRRGNGAPAPYFSLSYGRYNTTAISAGYGGQIGDTRFDINAGIEDSDAFSTYRNPVGGLFDPYNPDKDAYQNVNFNAQLSHRLTDKLEIGAQLFHVNAQKHFDSSNCDVFFSTCTSNYDNRSRQELDSYSAYLRVKPLDSWTSDIKLGQSHDRLKSWRLDPSIPEEFVDRYTTTQDQIAWENQISLGQWGKVLAAYDWRNEHVDSTQTFTTDSRRNNAIIGGYQGWYDAHSIQLSVRRDDISGFDPRTSTSIAYGYEILSGLRARVSAGHAFHVPTFNQLYWPADPINFFQGNPHLKVERAFNREAGLAYDKGNTQAGLTYFHNQVMDLLNYVPAFSSPYLGQYANIGRATLKGVSIFATQKIDNWTLRGSYDYLDAKNDETGLALQRRVPHSGSVSVDYHQDIWNGGVQVLAYSAHYNDSANTQRLGGYSLTNVYASRTLEGAWSVFARINNLLDRKYTEVRDPFNGNDYTTPGMSLFVGIRYSPK